jgi:hypothetical protein|mmetsp:Transcript_78033/g.123121  ORF Transcript_78033/g.123121 Transcript_78033/m.123121 type:complete len:467 (-) Transcript_78033:150-1550(-)
MAASMARKERSSPEKESEKTPQRWNNSTGRWAKHEGLCEGDEACGNSELSTHVISSPGVSSEADDAGGFIGTLGNGSIEKESMRSAHEEIVRHRDGRNENGLAPVGMLQQLARRIVGTGSWFPWANAPPDPGPPTDAGKSQDREQAERILNNLRVLATYREIFEIVDTDDPAHQAALETVAAAKRAEASRLAAERIGEERSAAERILVERLQREEVCAERLTTERLEAERLSMERVAAAAENERMMAERLQRVEAREALYEQQMAAEQSRVVLLRAELEAARREMESREKEVKLAEELKAREVHIVARTQCLESIHEDARREIESLRLQRHIAEVDLGRSRAELEKANARQKVLEEELRLLKERPPKVTWKPAGAKKLGFSKVLDRHDLASRCSFEERRESMDRSSSKDPVKSLAKPGMPLAQARAAEKTEASWTLFGCCSSPSNEGVRKEKVSANAPESLAKPRS